MVLVYLFVFLVSCVAIYFSGELVVNALTRTTRYLGIKEFVVAFFVMALASSLPNLLVGVSSALHQVPLISFADILGNNLTAITFAVALTIIIGGRGLPAAGATIQTTSLFTLAAATLPFAFTLDGILGRTDGALLVGFFLVYVAWLFSKRDHFTKNQPTATKDPPPPHRLGTVFSDLGRIAGGSALLLLAAEGIVRSARFFAGQFNLPLALIGMLVVGFGNALPETYFAVTSARRGHSALILGNLMGSVIIPASLVLGVVALIHPIILNASTFFGVARFFLILAALFFFFFVKSGRRVSSREAAFLLFLFLSFIVTGLILGEEI